MQETKKSEVITFRTDEETKALLEQISTKKRWSISQLAEMIISNNMHAVENAKEELERQGEKVPITVELTKNNDETIFDISEKLNISYDDAINLVIAHISLEWPFY